MSLEFDGAPFRGYYRHVRSEENDYTSGYVELPEDTIFPEDYFVPLSVQSPSRSR